MSAQVRCTRFLWLIARSLWGVHESTDSTAKGAARARCLGGRFLVGVLSQSGARSLQAALVERRQLGIEAVVLA